MWYAAYARTTAEVSVHTAKVRAWSPVTRDADQRNTLSRAEVRIVPQLGGTRV